MKQMLLLLLLFCSGPVFGQNAFINTIDGLHGSRNVRVFQTNDQGIVLFSLDSLKLYKFNACGKPEWCRQYALQIGAYPGSIIQTRAGGFALLNRIATGTTHSTSVTLLNAAGAVIWNRSYQDAQFEQFPYTICQAANGDFIIHGNVTHISNQSSYNFLSRIDANGNLRWTRFYNFGPIWGGAMVTSDNGILARNGGAVFKTDSLGNILWATASGSTTYYRAPAEVQDGYIYTGIGNGNKICFYKVDKQGNPVWGGRKVLNFSGTPPLFYQKANGNLAGVFNKTDAHNSYTSLIEFDQDLAIIKQNALMLPQSLAVLQGQQVGFSDENATVLTGTVSSNSGLGIQLFFARTGPEFNSGCDTLLAADLTLEAVSPPFNPSSNVLSHSFNTVNEPVTSHSIPVLVRTLCSNLIPQLVNIRGDSILCPGTSMILQNRTPGKFEEYLWSTGETSASISVSKPGKYWLKATYNCGASHASDTVTISEMVFPEPALSTDTTSCFNEPLRLQAELAGASYQWPDGSAHSFYYASKPGSYAVDITYQTCTKTFRFELGTQEKLWMPNIFTPNHDNRNDTFTPMEMCGIASGMLKIYNRWGQLLFTTTDLKKGWNGRVNSKKSSDGVYYYLVEYLNFRNEQKMKKGWLELVGS